VLFDIESIQQSAADILKGVELLNDGASSPKILSASSAANACALGQFSGGNGTEVYHTDSSDVPSAGEIVYTNPGGLSADLFDEGSNTHKFFKMLTPNDQGETLYALEVTASNGEILATPTPCSNFDSDPPSTFNYTFKALTINSGNKTQIPIEIHGLDDSNFDDNISLTVKISGSEGVSSGTNPIVQTETISSTGPNSLGGPAATHSFNFDCSTLNNGSTGATTAHLEITASDASNNPKDGTPLTPPSFIGHIISSSILTIGDYEVEFVTDNVGGTVAQKTTTALDNGLYSFENYSYRVMVKGLENNNGIGNPFVGTVSVTLSGQGNTLSKSQQKTAETNILASQSLVHFTDSGTTDLRTISNRSSSPYSNTVTATVNIIDAFGNTGPTKTTTTQFRDRVMKFYSGSNNSLIPSITVSADASSTVVKLLGPRQTNFSYEATASHSWITIDPSDKAGTVNNNSFNLQFAGHTGLARQGTITPRTLQGNTSGDLTDGHILTIEQEEYCVDPETPILTPTGQTLAKDIKVGDIVRTKMEFEVEKWVQDRVIRVVRISMSDKIKLTFTDGTKLITSDRHRIWHDDLGGWIEVSNFKPGDKASGKEVEKIEEAEYGGVVKITTEKHHTYISNGILSHNNKSLEENP
jgi:hypothetical protein